MCPRGHNREAGVSPATTLPRDLRQSNTWDQELIN
jgi:hypothetical protein